MGKRKQEIPRKLGANEESAVSKLEKIVKKLRGDDQQTNPPANQLENIATSRATGSVPNSVENVSKQRPSFSAKPKPANPVTSPHPSADQQPLDLRLHKSFNNNNKQPVVMTAPDCNQTVVSSSQTSSKISPSVDPSLEGNNKEPINVMGSFQELSAKLEQYFATGIAAAKFPRKMVRGQDMWIQDVEQKRRILKCLKCGHSYNSLTELSAHIKTSGHHDNITVGPDATSLRHCAKTSTVHVPVIKSTETKNSRVNSAPVEQRMQSTKPPRTSLLTSRTAWYSSKSIHLHGKSSLDQSTTSRNVSEFPANSEERNGLLRRPSAFTPVIKRRAEFHTLEPSGSVSPDRSKSSTKTTALVSEEQCERNGTVKMKLERPLADQASDTGTDGSISRLEGRMVQENELATKDGKVDNKMSVIEPSPLCALKRFLDFGIPRIRPNIIDGGRL
ncbi:hypothetical protein RvY_15092 [Ramazzottius varieornatus]|uniref:C2H2-type domain-containing protein n=1 Tax=Ramazzottius varieornatus TaxID=947166 RepID=A0A1D1VTP3_RAMVA|nr:hypothetical protein RvY_15092 [Ramazzottius varieornatus]